ncbi:antirestriction protein [Aquimarina algiphila]|uniref:Antirestriction protein n=1 Tax=Aquimarina algiphila TaxID=2047982 RepID=A0A554VBN9_9FLAO|nr:antirestriction protein [Aquimarina algiphila]TSE03940.1 antirestriction protein [Aquimarina algiphila]
MEKHFISFDNYERAIAQVNLKTLPEILQKGHQFFIEAKGFYTQENEIKETIDIYLDQLNEHLFIEQNTTLGNNNAIAEGFIKKFLQMHRTIQHRDALKDYIFDLQRAISKKEIAKDDLHAYHIEQIQQKLIVQHNNLILKEEVKIIINRKWRRQLHNILAGTIGTLGSFDGYTSNNDIALQVPKTKSSELFTAINNQSKQTGTNTFRLNDGLGDLLGDLEKFELALTIEGDQGGGKTRFTYQLADAFADMGNRIAIFSLEIGSRSDLITRMKEEYLQAKNQHQIFITDQLPEGYKTISNAAKDFDVIIIDSWNKTGLPSQDFDRLRKQHPNTIFIVIFQRTTQKTIRGGTAPLFDAGINIEIIKTDDTFRNNYAITSKNRYGVTGIKYNIFSKNIIEVF